MIACSAGETKTQDLGANEGEWSGGSHLWWTGAQPGAKLDLAVRVAKEGAFEVKARMTKAHDYGIVQFYMNDQKLGEPIDLYAANISLTGEMPLGTLEPARGQTQADHRDRGRQRESRQGLHGRAGLHQTGAETTMNLRHTFLLALAIIVTCSAAASAVSLTYSDLVKRLYDLEALSVLPAPGETCAQWSSYDRASVYDAQTGKYVNWDANGDGDGIIRKEGDHQVFAEMQGPAASGGSGPPPPRTVT